MPQEDARIRTIAGYLLKNNARLILMASPEVAAYVKSAVLTAFTDDSIMVRNAAGQDVVAFLGLFDLVEGTTAEDALLSVFKRRADILDNLEFGGAPPLSPLTAPC